MISFVNDYSCGAHPDVWKVLQEKNLQPYPGYGLDEESDAVRSILRTRTGMAHIDVLSVAGGTQANMLVISHMLKPFEAVIACDTGHINVHETGAIEGSGHKVLVMPHKDGKVTPEGIDVLVKSHCDEHMVRPAMVYVSQTTELGTIYTYEELKAIRAKADEHGLKLYVDGARLASAMAACPEVGLKELAELAHIFTIGGTKNGALFGEAIVLVDKGLQEDFRFMTKHKGALLAKGFAASIQIRTLLENGLYESIGEHANAMAMRIADCAKTHGWELAYPAESNQLFFRLPKEMVEKLSRKVAFSVIEPEEDTDVIRIVTAWSTTEEEVEALEQVIRDYALK